MSTLAPIEGSPTLRRYYGILTAGAQSYEDGRGLLPLLTDDFVFDGPIAGRIAGGTRFTHGVRGFIETVRDITILQAVVTSAGAAVLYDAELPHGTVRFSEFFQLDGDKIRELRIHYAPADYLASGGR
ncbi:nuclear transport factor 2 family protein [Arthrobacter sp. 35W]|uniref:nuclear transport factor 2 family protein n=1 Tax=Arthrobacter sp. 35W TaxID=1132441 RepID=UPI00040983D1|nr:nuclear transport factor 2 family protein [Arthrobacter sp. 35W]